MVSISKPADSMATGGRRKEKIRIQNPFTGEDLTDTIMIHPDTAPAGLGSRRSWFQPFTSREAEDQATTGFHKSRKSHPPQKKKLQRLDGTALPELPEPPRLHIPEEYHTAATPLQATDLVVLPTPVDPLPDDKQREATEENLSCSICFEEFKTPKVLSCGHTFCVHCTENMVDRKGLMPTLQCPTCRKDVTLPESGKTEDLITNFQLLSIINDKKGNTKGTQDGVRKQNRCEVHGQENKLYCQSCRMPMCFNCTLREHEVGKHSIITKKNFLEEQRGEVERLINTLLGIRAIYAKMETEFNQRKDSYIREIRDLKQEVQTALEEKQKQLAEDADKLFQAIEQSSDEPERKNQQFGEMLSLQRELLERAEDDTANLVKDLDAQSFPDGTKIEEIAASSTKINDNLGKRQEDLQLLQIRAMLVFKPSPNTEKVGLLSPARYESSAEYYRQPKTEH